MQSIHSYLKEQTWSLFIGLIVLSMLVFSAAAEDDTKQNAAPGDSVSMFSRGMTWDEFLDGIRIQRETWQKNAGRAVPPGLADRFKRAGNGLRLLVITAEWCPDSMHSVPYIAKLASEAGVEIRVLDFKTGKAIMDKHRTPDGRTSTPTVVLLRGNKEVGAWIEQPSSLQWWYLDKADEISKEELLERKMSWYEWNRGSDALGEIVVLAEQSAK